MEFNENIPVTENLPPLDAENARELADAIAEILDSKKARDIKVLHVEDKTVLEQGVIVHVLHLNRNAVTRILFTTIVRQQNVRFDTVVTKLARNERVHEFRISDAVRANQAQCCIHKVRREHQVLFIGKDFLDASVVVEIHVPVFVLFDKGVDVLPVIVCILEFAEKLSKFISFHYFFLNRGTAPEKRIESSPYLYTNTPLWKNQSDFTPV